MKEIDFYSKQIKDLDCDIETIDNDNTSHLIKTVTNSGGIITIVDENGTRVVQGKSTGRGVSTYLIFNNESSQKFWMKQYQFHKGTVYIETRILDEDSENFDETLLVLNDIWRD